MKEITEQQVKLEKILNKLGYQTMQNIGFYPYVADIFIYDLCLAIEVDGGLHKEGSRDKKRDKYLLEQYGVKTIRIKNELIDNFTDKELKEYVKNCLQDFRK